MPQSTHKSSWTQYTDIISWPSCVAYLLLPLKCDDQNVAQVCVPTLRQNRLDHHSHETSTYKHNLQCIVSLHSHNKPKTVLKRTLRAPVNNTLNKLLSCTEFVTAIQLSWRRVDTHFCRRRQQTSKYQVFNIIKVGESI